MDKKLKITHEGILTVGESEIPCYVLEDGTRVLSTAAMQRALSITTPESSKRTGSMIEKFLNGGKALKTFIESNNQARKIQTISCLYRNKSISAFEAKLLVDFCEIMLKAREEIELTKKQSLVAKNAEILMRSFAKIGIIALVDEATGYQYEREKRELQLILKQYISAELLTWHKRFPDEFYREIFRLNGWYFTVPEIQKSKRPGVIGSWTKKYIYSVLPKGVLETLLNVTPRNKKGKLKHKLHQHLTKDEGIDHLNKQIISTVTLMNVSDNWNQFVKLWNKKHGQQELAFTDYKLLEPEQEVSEFDNKLKKALEYNPKENK